MDLTEGTLEEKHARSKKMMLWFGIGSLIMSFAALTSAIIIRSSEEDWLNGYRLPDAFLWSCGIVIVSSLTFIIAKKAIENAQNGLATSVLVLTFILGIVFIYNQFVGFQQIIDGGHHFTSETSTVTTSFIYFLCVVHIAHVIAALISLVIVIIKQLLNKYSPTELLGIELAGTFWHFVGVLWLYLYLFLNYFENIMSIFK